MADGTRATGRTVALIATSIALVLAVLWLARALGLEEGLVTALQAIEGAGRIGQLWLMAIIVVVVVALLPGGPLTLGAGLLYGPFEGAALVVVATTIGTTLAMLIGRHLLSRPVALALRGRPRLAAALALPKAHDWRFVALLRMIPFFPGKLCNYVFGLTPLTVRAVTIGSLIGFWPIALFNAWLGSLAGSLLELQTGAYPSTPLGWTLWSLGLIGSGVLLLWLGRRATRRLDEVLA